MPHSASPHSWTGSHAGPGVAGFYHAEVDFGIGAVEKGLPRHGKPVIVDSDRGDQFASNDFIEVPAARKMAIGTDGRGVWRDNVFAERLWRSVENQQAAAPCIPRRPRDVEGGRVPHRGMVTGEVPIPAFP